MNKVISYLSSVTLIVTTTAVSSAAVAQGNVRFNLEPRGAGAGYNHTHVDRRVGQPKSILKGSQANRAVKSEQRFTRRLGSEVRSNMRHRGDVARHGRHNGQIKSTLNRQARRPKARFNTSQLSPEVRHNMDHRGNLARQARTNNGPNRTSATKTRTSGVRFDDTKRSRGAGYSASKPHNKVTKPKGILKNKNALKTAKKGRKLRTLGKVAAGGVVVAGGTMVVETALGVDIPDVVDAAEWTYGTFKDPKQAQRRFKKLGRDSLRTVHKAGRTLTNPKKMGRNLERGAKKAGKSIKKAGCSVGKLFGAKC